MFNMILKIAQLFNAGLFPFAPIGTKPRGDVDLPGVRLQTCCRLPATYADFKMCLMPRMGMTTQSGRLFSS